MKKEVCFEFDYNQNRSSSLSASPSGHVLISGGICNFSKKHICKQKVSFGAPSKHQGIGPEVSIFTIRVEFFNWSTRLTDLRLGYVAHYIGHGASSMIEESFQIGFDAFRSMHE